MARIENINIDGTEYGVGKIASTSDLGVVQVGSGLNITQSGILSATSGETMLVTLAPLQDAGEFNYTWTSDYTYAQLSANPNNIRIKTPSGLGFCMGNISTIIPDRVEVVTDEDVTGGSVIYWKKEYDDTYISASIFAPHEVSGQTIQGCYFDISRMAYKDSDNKSLVNYIELPKVTLASGVTEIPDGTTITLDITQDSELRDSNTSACEPVESYQWGDFIVLPVERVFDSSINSAIEYCLITETSSRSGSSPVSYRYKSFWSNGVKYKMTYTSSSGSSSVWTITKVPTEPVFTLQATDPGEGVSLEANHFIGVYDA